MLADSWPSMAAAVSATGEFGPQDSDASGATKASRTRLPLTSATVTAMPLLVTTFSPGFLVRTSMAILLEGENGATL